MTDALGRTKEARALLESRGPVPPGEVLKLSHWIAQMHLWVAEARATKPAETLFRDPAPAYKLEIDDLELHDRMRKGLSMTAGADLLLLCAWCYDHRGELEDAKFSYRQAKDSEGSHRLDVTKPRQAYRDVTYR